MWFWFSETDRTRSLDPQTDYATKWSCNSKFCRTVLIDFLTERILEIHFFPYKNAFELILSCFVPYERVCTNLAHLRWILIILFQLAQCVFMSALHLCNGLFEEILLSFHIQFYCFQVLHYLKPQMYPQSLSSYTQNEQPLPRMDRFPAYFMSYLQEVT